MTRFACCFHKVGVKGIHFTKLKRNLDTKVKTPKTKVFKCNRSHCYMIVRIEKYYLAYLLVILSTLCAVQGCSRKRARPPMLIARQLDVREEWDFACSFFIRCKSIWIVDLPKYVALPGSARPIAWSGRFLTIPPHLGSFEPGLFWFYTSSAWSKAL